MQQLATARVIFICIAASYLLSAAILGWVRSRGEAVAAFAIAGWAITGVVGIALSLLLASQRPIVWIGLLVALVPWMVYALIGDAGEKRIFMTIADAAGLGAIVWALWLSWPQMR